MGGLANSNGCRGTHNLCPNEEYNRQQGDLKDPERNLATKQIVCKPLEGKVVERYRDDYAGEDEQELLKQAGIVLKLGFSAEALQI